MPASQEAPSNLLLDPNIPCKYLPKAHPPGPQTLTHPEQVLQGENGAVPREETHFSSS